MAIVEAAGGKTSNRQGKPYQFNCENPLVDGVTATNGHIHGSILEIMDR